MSPQKKLFLTTLFNSGFAGDNRFLNTYFRWLGFKPGSGGGTAGSIVAAAILAIPILLEIHPLFFVFAAVIAYWTSPLLIIDAEIHLLERNNRKPFLNHKGKEVFADFNFTVWDELVGMIVTLIPLAAYSPGIPWSICLVHLVLGLAIFRIFDATKPSFIGTVENYYKETYSYYRQNDDEHNHKVAIGIMLDDVLAGIVAAFLCAGFILLLESVRS